jgi:acetate kinase
MTPDTQNTILAINAGSSSVKFQLFDCTPDLGLLAKGEVENIGATASFSATNEKSQHTDETALTASCTHENALDLILKWIEKDQKVWKISAVAHRIVHGGSIFKESVLVTPKVIGQIKALIPLDPLHQPHNIAAIEIITKIKPDVPQIACFDTAFHFGHDPLFTEYAVSKALRDKGIRRYGFHGLSYAWIVHTLRQNNPGLLAGKVIAAHLGNGASVCGMHNGISIDSSMGMTALEGLLMGTRSGNLDPGAVIYMIRDLGMSADEVEHSLYNEAGLLGLSGMTNDIKLLQESDTPDAVFALDYFSLRAAQYMGEMAVALGGVDGIIFTGGIGENSVLVRDKILARLEFMKPFEVHIIPANEERIMAMQAQSCLETQQRN